MVELDEEVSPASIPLKQLLTWSTTKKATNTSVEEDGNIINFTAGGGYRYCRSVEEFNSGEHRYEIEVNWGGKESQVSYGVCYDQNFNCDSGVYYFTNAYIYCNYYPSFTQNYTNIHTSTPPKLTENQKVAVNFDFDSKKIWWEINEVEYEKLNFETNGSSAFIVCGMFTGTGKFV